MGGEVGGEDEVGGRGAVVGGKVLSLEEESVADMLVVRCRRSYEH